MLWWGSCGVRRKRAGPSRVLIKYQVKTTAKHSTMNCERKKQHGSSETLHALVGRMLQVWSFHYYQRVVAIAEWSRNAQCLLRMKVCRWPSLLAACCSRCWSESKTLNASVVWKLQVWSFRDCQRVVATDEQHRWEFTEHHWDVTTTIDACKDRGREISSSPPRKSALACNS